MNPDPVDQDLMRHQRQLDQDEARDLWRYGEASTLASKWRQELYDKKIIVDLGWENADLNQQAADEGKEPSKCLFDMACRWVSDHEDDFLQRTVGWD